MKVFDEEGKKELPPSECRSKYTVIPVMHLLVSYLIIYRVGRILHNGPSKAAITPEWSLLSCAQFTCDIYAKLFLLLLRD